MSLILFITESFIAEHRDRDGYALTSGTEQDGAVSWVVPDSSSTYGAGTDGHTFAEEGQSDALNWFLSCLEGVGVLGP
jgi:hypothetical protein